MRQILDKNSLGGLNFDRETTAILLITIDPNQLLPLQYKYINEYNTP